MYSLAVGAFASADMFATLGSSLTVNSFQVLGARRHASQYIFMVTISPASKASQSRPVINRGAAASIPTLAAIFTASHTKNPNPAVAAFSDENRLINPRANKAAGSTTHKAP